MLSRLRKYFGPSTLVAAAFIGPGTLTVCTMAGVKTGYELLWALIFAVISTVILQEMAARLGLVTQKGLGEAIRKEFSTPIARVASILVVFSAIIIGNAAYEAGNIGGAVLGLDTIHSFSSNIYPIIIGAIAFALLWTGSYQLIERFLIALVLTMSLVFLVTAILVQPNLSQLGRGMFIPSIPDPLLVLGIIGTTVVPYNLFLHASSISEKWKDQSELKTVRIENAIAIIIGGFISVCIIITSAAMMGNGEVSNAADMALQLEPLLGSWAKYFFALGLFSAGLSSAITAPLAAAYAARGIFGWDNHFKDMKFKMVWMFILGIGILFSFLGFKPILVIQFAQIANAILLPIIAIFLIYIMNKESILGTFKNGFLQNILSGIVVLTTVALSIKSLNSLFSFI